MKKSDIKSFIKKNNVFLSLYFLFLLAGGTHVVFYPKESFLLWLNAGHNVYLDIFFKYITNLGDGLFTLLIVIVLLFIKFRYAVYVCISFLLSGIVIQIMKYYIDTPRPMLFFKQGISLYVVPGIDIYYHNSFPSGHTATAISLFFLLSVFTGKKYLQVLFFLLFVSVALSRIYLLQHFFIDVYFGSIIGFIASVIICAFSSQSEFLKNFLFKFFKK